MKDAKGCRMTACCWSHRHGVVGLILLVIATLLTIATHNGIAIAAMFVAGIGLCCHKHWMCHCGHHHHHEHDDCCISDESCEIKSSDEKKQAPAKKVAKAPKK